MKRRIAKKVLRRPWRYRQGAFDAAVRRLRREGYLWLYEQDLARRIIRTKESAEAAVERFNASLDENSRELQKLIRSLEAA